MVVATLYVGMPMVKKGQKYTSEKVQKFISQQQSQARSQKLQDSLTIHPAIF